MIREWDKERMIMIKYGIKLTRGGKRVGGEGY